MLGIISLSFLLTIVYLATRSVFICIVFHALENAYLNIGLDSWISGPISGWVNALGGLGISILLFWLYRHFTQFLTHNLSNECAGKK
jgi:membrane protein implicated in regulation of membrane protease activity